MARHGMSSIVLYRPAWEDGHPLAVSGLVVTWAVESPGSLSCFVPVNTLTRLGLDDVIGLWAFYRHPTQGVWSGIIEDEPGTIDDQTVEFSCVDMRGLVMGRRTPVLYRIDTAHAGALARRALGGATTTDPLPFTELRIDETGRPLEAEWRGDDTYDLLSALANQSGQEWDVEVDEARGIAFVWQERLGDDKRDTVLIREGATVTSGRVDRSRTTITNDIAGVAADESYEKSSYHQTEDAASIARYGRRQSPVRRYEGVVAKSMVRAKTQADKRREALGYYLPTVTMSALHPVCHEIRHGDTIRYWSSSKNRELDFRVMSRTVRDGTILELAGEAVEVRIPPRHRPFTPDMLSGLVAWYDADDLPTVVVRDGAVWEWHDKSGNGNHLVSPGGFAIGGNPGFSTPNGLNGTHVIAYAADGGASTAADIDLTATNAVTVYLVANVVGDNPSVQFGDTASDAGSWDVGSDASDDVYAGVRGNVGPNTRTSTTAWGNAWHRVTALFNFAAGSSAEVALWVDGSNAGSASGSNNSGSFGSHPLDVNPSAGSQKGFYAEILVFDRGHTTTQREAVEGYLSGKWGL